MIWHDRLSIYIVGNQWCLFTRFCKDGMFAFQNILIISEVSKLQEYQVFVCIVTAVLPATRSFWRKHEYVMNSPTTCRLHLKHFVWQLESCVCEHAAVDWVLKEEDCTMQPNTSGIPAPWDSVEIASSSR